MCNLSLLRLQLCWQLLLVAAGLRLEAMVDPTVPPSDNAVGRGGQVRAPFQGQTLRVAGGGTRGILQTHRAVGEMLCLPSRLPTVPRSRDHLCQVSCPAARQRAQAFGAHVSGKISILSLYVIGIGTPFKCFC